MSFAAGDRLVSNRKSTGHISLVWRDILSVVAILPNLVRHKNVLSFKISGDRNELKSSAAWNFASTVIKSVTIRSLMNLNAKHQRPSTIRFDHLETATCVRSLLGAVRRFEELSVYRPAEIRASRIKETYHALKCALCRERVL